MTLEELGERIGLKKSTLSNIENGNANLTDQTRRSICREFNVREEWLLTGEGEPFAAKSRNDEIAAFVNELQTDNEGFKAKLVTILSRMTPDEWDLLERMIRRIADLDSEEVAPVQQSTVEAAEEEYIKSASEPVPPMVPAASNSTAGDGDGETA